MTFAPGWHPAPAKINLALHILGRRADGYHLLDSLVVFTEAGDRVAVAAGEPSLAVTGPFAADVPLDDSNLCLRAARSVGVGAAITLHKALPVASGIGAGRLMPPPCCGRWLACQRARKPSAPTCRSACYRGRR